MMDGILKIMLSIACALKSCSLMIITTTTWAFYIILKFYHSLLV